MQLFTLWLTLLCSHTQKAAALLTMSSEMALRRPTLGRFCLLTAVLRRLPPWARSEYSDSTSAGKDLCSRPVGGMSPLGGWSGMLTTARF